MHSFWHAQVWWHNTANATWPSPPWWIDKLNTNKTHKDDLHCLSWMQNKRIK
jgi:hypothetical protein